MLGRSYGERLARVLLRWMTRRAFGFGALCARRWAHGGRLACPYVVLAISSDWGQVRVGTRFALNESEVSYLPAGRGEFGRVSVNVVALLGEEASRDARLLADAKTMSVWLNI